MTTGAPSDKQGTAGFVVRFYLGRSWQGLPTCLAWTRHRLAWIVCPTEQRWWSSPAPAIVLMALMAWKERCLSTLPARPDMPIVITFFTRNDPCAISANGPLWPNIGWTSIGRLLTTVDRRSLVFPPAPGGDPHATVGYRYRRGPLTACGIPGVPVEQSGHASDPPVAELPRLSRLRLGYRAPQIHTLGQALIACRLGGRMV